MRNACPTSQSAIDRRYLVTKHRCLQRNRDETINIHLDDDDDDEGNVSHTQIWRIAAIDVGHVRIDAILLLRQFQYVAQSMAQ